MYKVNFTKIKQLNRASYIPVYWRYLGWQMKRPLKLCFYLKSYIISQPFPIPLPSILSVIEYSYQRGKKARNRSHYASKHRSQGGIGFPVLRYYYRAAILDQLKAWFKPAPGRLYISIENVMVSGQDMV